MDGENNTYDVVIVGAGWSGLLACKYCLAEGLKTLVLESRSEIGGVWHYTDDQRFGGVMKTTNSTSSRCITEISDYPMPGDFPEFPSHEQINRYLASYCEHFSLTEHIRLNAAVTDLAKRDSVWTVSTSDGIVYAAKNVILCAGVHQHPNDISVDRRFAGFSGQIVHSAAVKEVTDDVSGKNIIVFGGGESASDIAVQACNVGARVYFCIPNGQWFVPKIVERWPPFPSSRRKVVDHTSSRLRNFLSPTHRYSPFISQYLQYALGFNGHGQEAWRTKAPYNRSFLNKSAEVLALLKDGAVVPKRDISHCENATVQFSDGTRVDADRIILCSGYSVSFPFLCETVSLGTDPRSWFKYIFNNEDPSLSVVGTVRPVFGSIPGIAELQSRYVAKVYAGKRKLPDRESRTEIIKRDSAFWDHHFRRTSLRLAGLVDHFIYSNQLAKLIGCYPDFLRLFFSSPGKWWKAVTAPWNSCQFWLNDVGHHERIFETFQRYDDNRISQIYTFIVLAPVLPLIGAFTSLKLFFADRLAAAQPVNPAEGEIDGNYPTADRRAGSG